MCDIHKFRGGGGMFENGSKNLKGTPTKSWSVKVALGVSPVGFFFI